MSKSKETRERFNDRFMALCKETEEELLAEGIAHDRSEAANMVINAVHSNLQKLALAEMLMGAIGGREETREEETPRVNTRTPDLKVVN